MDTDSEHEETLESLLFGQVERADLRHQLQNNQIPESVEGQRLNEMLKANRRLQAEITGNIENLDSMLAELLELKTVLNKGQVATGEDDAESLILPNPQNDRKQTLTVMEKVAMQRLKPTMFFYPFFKYKGSVPPPNEHCTDDQGHLERMKNVYFGQKSVTLHFKEEEHLNRLVYLYMTLNDGVLAERLLSMNIPECPYRRKIPIYSIEALKLALDITDNAPEKWGNDKWEVIMKATSFMRTASECRETFLYQTSPLVNRSEKPTTNELQQLKTLIENSEQPRDWGNISKELGTNRPPADVFEIYIQHIKKPGTTKTDGWDIKDDAKLHELYNEMGPQMNEIAYRFSGKYTLKQVVHRIRGIIPAPSKGKWTVEEDERILYAVEMFRKMNPDAKTISWREVSDFVQSRNEMQCRNRFEHTLNTEYDRSKFTEEDADKLVKLVEEIETKGTIKGEDVKGLTSKFSSKRSKTDGQAVAIPWTYLSKQFFPTRKDSFIKNWYASVYKKQKNKSQ